MIRRALVVLVLLGQAGCPGPSIAPDVRAAECVSHRTALELACVDQYGTRAEIDACRAKVKGDHDCVIADAGGQ
ncbi:MAG: hypothetical protein EBR82_12145 [Caulobacteraceae bacterium]|nr:hypothetical protein [Caulobacteraceae bacterium]